MASEIHTATLHFPHRFGGAAHTDGAALEAPARRGRSVEPAGPERQAAPSNGPADGPASEAGRPGRARRRLLAAAVGLPLLLGAGAAGAVWWEHAAHFESTDDAFIAARQFAVAAKVAGYITAVPVTDNQHVAAGDVIARIDDRDYRAALARADAAVASAQAGIANIDAQIKAQTAQIAASRAQVEQARARLVFAKQEAARYGTLTKDGWSSRQTGELAVSQLYQQKAALGTAEADQTVAERDLEALEARRSSAVASLKQAEAQQRQARLNLSYTTVSAAQPGRIVLLDAAVGQLAQPGSTLSMFVPDELWVTANFKETQLDAMRPGQRATLEIDAYPGRRLAGHVASVQPGSGTAFSLLPAENATGNYVKIVQRVPVKIVLDRPPGDVTLGPGMSVVPTVRTDPRPSLFERLQRSL
jgi:membrane fusion protein (multidrug efflux system)